MRKKMKIPFPFLSKRKQLPINSSSSWTWPSCHQPRTLSFRTPTIPPPQHSMFKTINSAYLDDNNYNYNNNDNVSIDSASCSFSSVDNQHAYLDAPESVEMMIRGLKSSDRLIFEPEENSSILNQEEEDELMFLKSNVKLSTMESKDPFVDFKQSMEEMVEAHNLDYEWEGLEELLCCYLRVNGKSNHGYIVSAFVDLITKLSLSSSSVSVSDSTINASPFSPFSFSTYSSNTSNSDDVSTTHNYTPLSSLLEGGDEIEDDELLSS